MPEYLALDWDDQRLVGVAAQVASKHVEVRTVLDFTWAEGEIPSEQPAAAGKRLRTELEQASVSHAPVIVSLPREDAIVRLLELPDCSDDELPELVRFQAVTRSAVPLDKLLLDYLPLPPLKDVTGRRVWMATIGKPIADRVQTMLSAAGLDAAAISVSSLGAAELVSHQSGAAAAPSDPATLVVSCVDLRIEITAIWQNRIVLMHAATLSSHDPPEAQLTQILAETARSTVALSQAAPGLEIGSGWLIGPRTEHSPLAEGLAERFGFKFHVVTDPASTPGVTAQSSTSLAKSPLAWAPLGLLLEQAAQRVDSIDFLHPRRQHPKPDRRKLYIGLGAAAAVLLLAIAFGEIQRRVWQLDTKIADMTAGNKKMKELLDKNAPLHETAGSVEDWTRRDIDWLEQFRVLEQAKNGADKIYLTTFDANVGAREKLAVVTAAGRAKLPNDVDDFEDQLVALGYRLTPKEISEDATDPQYPVKIDLSVELVNVIPKPATTAAAAAARSASAPKPEGSSQPGGAPATTAPPPRAPSSAPPTGRAPANVRQAASESATVTALPASEPATAKASASPPAAAAGEAEPREMADDSNALPPSEQPAPSKY
jgi:hypothetical protein